MLEVHDLHSGYGKIEILKGIRLHVPAGKIVSLIGSNGAGKTTFLMTLSGIVKSKKGNMRFYPPSPCPACPAGRPLPGGDRDRVRVGGYVSLEKLSPDQIVRGGLVQVPEGRRIFQHLTVEENLDLGAYARHEDKLEIAKDREEMLDLFPILKARLKGLAGNLSGGEQQMLAMARALMARPRMLLLDEPSLGLAPKMIEVVFLLIQRINEKGLTILLVEQNAYKALALAHYGYVIESGRIQLEGTGKELLSNPQVKRSYLGE